MTILSFSKKNILTAFALIFAIIIWFFLKVFQFQLNDENYSDGLLALQLSRGWLEGRPILFDTYYGDHALQHNYYFIVLVGLFTKFTGVYGLFIAYLILLGIFLVQWHRALFSLKNIQKFYIILASATFVFGPMAFFIYMDFLGWHPEQYFLPLMALLALALARRTYFVAAIWLLLIISVKETASVLLCGLLLFVSVTDSVLKTPDQSWHRHYLTKRNFLIAASCLTFFCLSLIWLSYLNAPNVSRLRIALANVREHVTIGEFVISSLGSALVAVLTFLIGFIPFWPLLNAAKQKKPIIVVLSLGFSLLFIVFFTESFYYFGLFQYGVSYPARIGGLWAYLFSCYIYLFYRMKQTGFQMVPTHSVYLFTSLAFQFALAPYLIGRDSYSKRHGLRETVNYIIESDFGLNPYPRGLSKQLHSLAKRLPQGAEVVCDRTQAIYFHNFYASNWDNGKKLHILGRPMIYIYEKKLVNKTKYYRYPKKGYIPILTSNLLILTDSLWYNQNFQ